MHVAVFDDDDDEDDDEDDDDDDELQIWSPSDESIT